MRKYLILLLISLIFFITRLYKITEIPSSVYWDEASIGYNAYSIANYGIDEWGQSYPAHFRAFGEFKLPVYIYSVAVLLKMGLNLDLALRLPSVIFSFGSLLFLYLLALKIFDSSKYALVSVFYLRFYRGILSLVVQVMKLLRVCFFILLVFM